MFGFPSTPRPPEGHFKKNLLKSVTFQLKFQQSGEIVEGFRDKKESLKNEFPIISQININTAQITFKDKTPIIQAAKSPGHGVQFKSQNNEKILAITEDTFTYTISGPEYQNFYIAFKEIKDKFFPFFRDYHITNFHRIATRKINLVEPIDTTRSNKELLRLTFHKDLIQNLNHFPDITNISNGFTNVTFEKDDKRLNLIYGLVSPKPKKKQILLDIDLFFIDQNIPLDSIESKFEEINNEIFNIFNWALSDEMKADISNN